MNQDKNRKITVEDLLTLKRAERPPAEFWARFESEMRAKQLSAIVGKRTWRDSLRRGFAAAYRLHLPFGAAAALALTWASIHYSSDSLTAVRSVPAAAPVARPLVAVSAKALAIAPAAEHQVAPVAQIRSELPERAPASLAASDAPRAIEETATVSPEFPTRARFSDAVAATLADFRQDQPELAKRDVFSSDREFETTVEAMRQPAVDPLARVDPVSDERRARLLATSLPAYTSSSPASLASERVRDRVSNDRMYESMDPYESNSRMSLDIKF
jgi:hypothetical protein